MTFDTPINLTDQSFERAVLQSSLPVVADFWASQDSSRQKLDSVLRATAESYAGELLVAKLEVGDAVQAQGRYAVDTLPEFLFFRNGRLVARAKGTPSVEALRPWVKYLLERGPKPTAARPRQRSQVPDQGKPVHVTDATFDQIVLRANVPVIVDFFASWCAPCRAVAPALEALAEAYAGRALVAKVDVDANQSIARRFHVMSVPTLIFFQNGREVDRVTGAQPRHVLEQRLTSLL